MTPTSSERREVAERLRDAAHTNASFDMTVVIAILGVMGEVQEPIASVVADLIDPTCDAEQDYDRDEPIQGRWWKCDVCGEHFIYERGFAPRFCPECGARVVNE